MACPIHGDRPRPSLCHDCARVGLEAVPAPLRITDEDRGALRIILEPGRKAVTIVRR